jgi:arylsulfatase
VRWPGLIKSGTEINAIFAQEDWLPTLVAAVGDTKVKDELLKGYQAGAMTYKVHRDGYDQRDLLSGKGNGARKEFLYWTDDGDLAGLRFNQWKLVFSSNAHRV